MTAAGWTDSDRGTLVTALLAAVADGTPAGVVDALALVEDAPRELLAESAVLLALVAAGPHDPDTLRARLQAVLLELHAGPPPAP